MAKQGQADRFHQGTMTDGWRWFGAHPAKKRGRDGWTFRVWAPHAEAVSVVGDFNDWEEGAAPLARKGEIWEGFLPDLPVYTSYKYAVRGADGEVRQKADPTASTQRPGRRQPASCMTSADSSGRTALSGRRRPSTRSIHHR